MIKIYFIFDKVSKRTNDEINSIVIYILIYNKPY